MTLIYVATPAFFALLSLAGAFATALALRPLPGAVRVSLWVGGAQGLLVAFSAWQTFEYSISRVACLTSMLGWMGLAIIGMLDALSLLWWLWSRRGEGGWTGPILFVLLRLASHVLLSGALLWHAALCTV
jgi:hypothetical protein